MSSISLNTLTAEQLGNYLWEVSHLNEAGNLSYSPFFGGMTPFRSQYQTWVESIFPDILNLTPTHQDWSLGDALESVFKCFGTLDHEDIFYDLISMLALVNDITKVKSKSYPKMRRDFYDIKAQIIGFLFRQHLHLSEMWWEENEGRRYLVLSFTNNKGKVEWTFHQPERNFRNISSRQRQSLESLPTKPYHWEAQTFLPAHTLERMTVGEYERMVSWLTILYHLFINVYNQNY